MGAGSLFSSQEQRALLVPPLILCQSRLFFVPAFDFNNISLVRSSGETFRRASLRAEHARRSARSTRVGAHSRPADPAFLLGRSLAERSRRLGSLERAGAAGRGAPAVSPRRCGASSTPLEAYSQQ